jgi:hypothetical protein
MMKSFRTLLFIFAVLTIFAHMVIPHDHHAAGSLSGVNDSCPLSGEKTGHHPLFPNHCHAFNDLASEKFTPVIRQFNNVSHVMLVPANDFVNYGLCEAAPANLAFAEHSPVSYLTDQSPFRAPPYFA